MNSSGDIPFSLNDPNLPPTGLKGWLARADQVSAHIYAVVASDRATGEFGRALAQGRPVSSSQIQFTARVRWYVEQLGNIFTFLKSFVQTCSDPAAKEDALTLIVSPLTMLPKTRFPGDDSLTGFLPYAWGAYEMLLATNHLYVGQEIVNTHQMVQDSYAAPGALPTINSGKLKLAQVSLIADFYLSAAEAIAPFQPESPITNPAGAATPTPASPPPQVTTQRLKSGPNLPPAQLHRTPFPTLAKPEAVLLEGIVATANLGGYSLTYYSSKQVQELMVNVPRANPKIGGSYRIGNLPIGEWFVLTDRHDSLLPVAVQKIREDAYQVRVDSAPLQGLRAVTSMPGY